ncbi:TPA_asm: L [Peat soil associated betacytorhabdovirus 2]|jgi:hypothetical protein|nr:TPA_asm: L [Peat soil associated betacytorhabdovirus 2]
MDLDFEDVFKERNKRGLGDFHLRSALLLVDIESLQNGGGRVRERSSYIKIKSHFSGERIIAGYPVKLMIEIAKSLSHFPETTPGFIGDALDLLRTERRALSKMFPRNDPFDKAIEVINRSNIGSPLIFIRDRLLLSLLFLMSETSERVPPNMDFIMKDEELDYICFREIKIWLTGELICWRKSEREPLELLSLDSFRMICDKFTERANVFIATTIGHGVFPLIYPKWSIIEEIFTYFDQHLMRHGNNGYKLLKTYEALITGVILSKEHCRYWNSSKFLMDTISNLSKEDGYVALKFCNHIKEQDLTIHHLTQIMGLFRLWGHPVVDARKGVEKVRLIGTKKKAISSYTAKIAGYQLLEILFTQYYNKNHIYPPHLINPSDSPTYLESCLVDCVSINLKDPNYSILSWQSITVSKTFDIPSSFNLSMIVADTAISPTREEMRDCFLEGKPGLDPTVRRGVLKWMKDGVLDCPSLLSHVNENPRGLPKTHRIIGLYQKEREMNPVARMFALMSLILRSVMVVTEGLLADHVLPLIPGITMTYSMLDLTKEMIRATWRQRDIDKYSVTFCINMDFEKWNLNMRQEATFPTFKILGDLFGLSNLYNRTYDLFRNSIIYKADGSFILPLDENLDLIQSSPNDAYIGHLGGFEGLRQKGWTIFTVVLIHYCCRKLNIDWKLMGQGDNQVLLATIYSKTARESGLSSVKAQQEIRCKLDELMSELIETFNSVGLPLKPLETWISDTYFSYGKFPLYKGMPCSISLKKLSRVFFFSNEDVMTLDNAMGSVTTNAQSAIMADVHPIVPYFIAKLQHLQCVSLFLNYHPLLGKSPITDQIEFTMRKENRTTTYSTEIHLDRHDILKALVSYPKTLGGLNSITIFNTLMRGFSDPVNMDFQWLNAMTENTTGGLRRIMENIKTLMLNPEINYSYLIQDPVGLNLFVPTNSNQAIKQMIHRVIENLPFESEFSEWFKEVMVVSKPQEIEELAIKMINTDQVNIRFLHDILGSTIFGYCDSITSKIDKTVTLSRIALSQEDVVGKIMKNEERYINYLMWRLTTPGNFDIPYECPSYYIRKAREVGWKKEIIGVSVPFPFHFLDKMSIYEENDSYLISTMDDEALVSQGYALSTIGKSLPYLGSITREKIPISATRLAYGVEPLITRPVKMLRVIGWFVEEESNFAELLKNLIRAVSNIEPELLINIPDEVKGSMVHRYSDFATKHGSLWMLLHGPATFCNLSTNYFSEFAKGSKNVTLHFQAVLCYLQFMSVCTILTGGGEKVLRLKKCCEECITEVVDKFEDLPERIPVEMIPTRPENPYLFLRSEQVTILTRYTEQKLKSIRRVKIHELKPQNIYRYLIDWLSCRIATQIFFQTGESNDYLLDVQNIPRVMFLKLNPYHILEGIVKFLFLISTQRDESNKTFPTFKTVKNNLLKSMSRFAAGRFGLFSGFFLWGENFIPLRRVKATFPMTFPATAQSAAEASKRTIIDHVKNHDDNIHWNTDALVINMYENQFPYFLKQVTIKRKTGDNSCPYCIYRILHIKIKIFDTSGPIMFERCERGHHVFELIDLKYIRYLPASSIETLGDMIPTLSYPTQISDTELHLCLNRSEVKLTEKVIFNSKLIIGYGDLNIQVKSKYPNGDGRNHDLILEQRFNEPTRGFYRAIEMLSGLDGNRMNNKKILVMGDGFGGSSLAISAMMKNKGKVFSWTYIKPSEGLSHCLQESQPPMLYYFDNLIDVKTSFEEISDVGHPSFPSGFSRVIERNKITTLISDIEWWYVGEDYTVRLIQLSHKNKIREVSLRLYLTDLDNVIRCMEAANSYFHHWSVAETININRTLGDLLLHMSGPKESPMERNFNEETVSRIESYCFSKRVEIWSSTTLIGSYTKSLESELMKNDQWMTLMYKICEDWFSRAEIVGWQDIDFTRLYYSLKTGRRPVTLEDVSGSEIFYFRDSWYGSMIIRLLALGMSLCEDPSEVSNALEYHWEPHWVVTTGRYLGRKKNDIRLIRSSGTSRLSSSDRRKVASYSSLIRAVRDYLLKEKSRKFPKIGEEIRFKYIPREKMVNDVTLRISKIASYSLV